MTPETKIGFFIPETPLRGFGKNERSRRDQQGQKSAAPQTDPVIVEFLDTSKAKTFQEKLERARKYVSADGANKNADIAALLLQLQEMERKARLITPEAKKYVLEDSFIEVFEQQGILIKELVGEGAYGAVFHGEHIMTGRDVAVKVSSMSEREVSVRKRFMREADILTHMNHPNLVAVDFVDVVKDGGVMVMEYIEGGSLEQIISKIDSLHVQLNIIAKVARGLAEAHDANILHRDIKPANVFILKNTPSLDAEDNVRLGDFGLARGIHEQAIQRSLEDVERAIEEEKPPLMFTRTPEQERQNMERRVSPQETREGVAVGSVAYMAPEVWDNGDEKKEKSIDMFALGVLSYEVLLRGQRPFPGTSADVVRQKILHIHPKAPHKIDKTIPEDLSNLVMCLLSKKPSDRPDIHQFLDRLVLILERENEQYFQQIYKEMEEVSKKPKHDPDVHIFFDRWSNVLGKHEDDFQHMCEEQWWKKDYHETTPYKTSFPVRFATEVRNKQVRGQYGKHPIVR